jgi:hypothetical protein
MRWVRSTLVVALAGVKVPFEAVFTNSYLPGAGGR